MRADRRDPGQAQPSEPATVTAARQLADEARATWRTPRPPRSRPVRLARQAARARASALRAEPPGRDT